MPMAKTISAIIILALLLGIILTVSRSTGTTFSVASGRLANIKERGEIVIGSNARYAPFESIDEQGNFVGLDMDIVREIARDIGVTPVFIDIPWEELFDTLRAGKIDVAISSITITKERAETMSFSDPYINAGQVVVTLVSRGDIKGTHDLRSQTVGVQTETTSETEARTYSDHVFVYPNYAEAKADLLSRKTDAIIIDYPAGVAMAGKDSRLKVVGEPFTQEFYGVATGKNETALLAEINKTIRRLKQDGKLKEFERTWLGQ